MLNEFDNLLQGLLSLKPPGITTSKIKEFTTLCSQNVQSESILIQKLYMQFKKSPPSHKLGILYIVDSVARDYMTQAKKANEEYSPSAPDGTYYAGLNRIKDILPSLINDMAQYAPEHKDKIYKLFDIWQRGATFPPEAIAQWRTKLASPPTSPNVPAGSTTPLGSPPQQYQTLNTNGTQPQSAQQASQANAASLLQALANMAKQNKPAGASGVIVPSVSTPPPAISTTQSAPVIPPQPTPAPLSQSLPAPYNALGSLPNLAPNFASLLSTPQLPLPQTQQPSQQTAAQLPQFPQPQIPLQPNVADPNIQAGQLALLQLLLQQQGLPVNQLGTALGGLFGVPPAAATAAWQQIPQQQQQQSQQATAGIRFDEQSSRDRSRNYTPPPRSPHYRRGRSRSRSPPAAYAKHRDSPPFRRRSPTYNDYEETADGRSIREGDYHRGGGGGGRGRGRRGSPRRERSRTPPARNGRRNLDRFDHQGNEPSGPKFYEHDLTVPSDSIKVYSRTLFVGGVARNTEQELRELFETYGRVQTCIVNYDKRHAFIKMYTRKDAVTAKEAMEQYRSPEMTLRTRWGVGFGPRDCSDYTTGISIIPIDRLTDADKRWMLTAGNGGTGGQPLVGGVAVEEPDIEIGQGVSSKAMSKRRPADSRGPQSSEDNANNPRRNDRQSSAELITGGVAPPTPNFGSAPFAGFPYTFAQGMPGWMFPGQQQQ